MSADVFIPGAGRDSVKGQDRAWIQTATCMDSKQDLFIASDPVYGPSQTAGGRIRSSKSVL